MRLNGAIWFCGLILAGCATTVPVITPEEELVTVLEARLPAPKAPLLLPVYRENALLSTAETIDPDKVTLFLRQPRRLSEPEALVAGADAVPGTMTAPEPDEAVASPETGSETISETDLETSPAESVVSPALLPGTPEWVVRASRDFAYLLVITPDGRIGRLTRRTSPPRETPEDAAAAPAAVVATEIPVADAAPVAVAEDNVAAEPKAAPLYWEWEELPRRHIAELTGLLELCILKNGEKRRLFKIPDSEFRFLRADYTPEETLAVLNFLRNIPAVQ